jgi:hypothetical protein
VVSGLNSAEYPRYLVCVEICGELPQPLDPVDPYPSGVPSGDVSWLVRTFKWQVALVACGAEGSWPTSASLLVAKKAKVYLPLAKCSP